MRPARYIPGARSPLKHPEGIDYVIVRENLEDLYLGLEGPLEVLSPLKLHSRITRAALDTSMPGKFAIKIITERNSKRIAEFAFKLARKRKAAGGKGKVTATSKYNMLRESDELFRRIAEDISSGLSGYRVRTIHHRRFRAPRGAKPARSRRGRDAEPLRRHHV